jgi:hypothetical protein
MYVNENDVRNLQVRYAEMQREAANERIAREITREKREARRIKLRQSANALSRFVSLFL